MQQHCEQFGFDQKKIQQHLAFLRLSKADHKLAKRLQQEVIVPNADRIVDRFYETLLFHPVSRKWLLDGETIDRLKTTQKAYLLNLGINFNTAEYFNERLHIGVVHAVVGLPLSTYQVAYSNLNQYILDAFPESNPNNPEDSALLTNFVIRITSLDMSLAIETYHTSFLTELEDEVKAAHIREHRLKDLAATDALTGLYNRKFVFSYLEQAIHNAQQHSHDLCLLMLDVDYFKQVNDNFGHQAGDVVLQQVAYLLSSTLREQDILGRYGGEEFILGLPGVAAETALRIADRIRMTISHTPISIGKQSLNITISIGFSALDENDNLDNLIERSDRALYSAKQSGRNCVARG